jgi:hypothetical protein
MSVGADLFEGLPLNIGFIKATCKGELLSAMDTAYSKTPDK